MLFVITIILLLLIAFLFISSNPSVMAKSIGEDENDLLDKENIAEIFDFGT
jgi:hypothetical protein